MQPQSSSHSQDIPWSFNHLGVAVPDIAKAFAFYEQAFGFTRLTDVYRDDLQQVKVTFIGPPQDFTDRRARGFVLELVEPASTDSHLARLLKGGGGAYHICYAVSCMTVALERLTAFGCIKVRGPEPAVAYFGKPIAWCYAPTRHLIELVQV